MIPAFSKDAVSYKDSDNTTYTFLPKTGILERELVAVFSDTDNNEALVAKTDALIDKILLTPKPKDLKPSEAYNSEEKMELVRYWNIANRLTIPEKKS